MKLEEFTNHCKNLFKQQVGKKGNRLKYLRRNDGSAKGMVVVIEKEGVQHVGWSLCHKNEKFDKYKGFYYACRDARPYSEYLDEHGCEGLPQSVRKHIEFAANKCATYIDYAEFSIDDEIVNRFMEISKQLGRVRAKEFAEKLAQTFSTNINPVR